MSARACFHGSGWGVLSEIRVIPAGRKSSNGCHTEEKPTSHLTYYSWVVLEALRARGWCITGRSSGLVEQDGQTTPLSGGRGGRISSEARISAFL